MRMRRGFLLPLGQRRPRRLPRPERRRRAPRCPRLGPGQPRAAVDAGVGVRAGHELAVRPRRLPRKRNRGRLGRRRFRPGVTRAPTERVPAGVVPGHERRVGILHRLVRGAVHGIVVVRVRTETSTRHRRRRRRRRGIIGVAGRRARRGVTGGASAVVVRLVRGHEERLVVRHAADSANPPPPETTRGLPAVSPPQCGDGDSQRPGVLAKLFTFRVENTDDGNTQTVTTEYIISG